MVYEETTTETKRSFDENNVHNDTVAGRLTIVEEGSTETVSAYDRVNLNPVVYRPAVGDGRLIVRYSFADKKLA